MNTITKTFESIKKDFFYFPTYSKWLFLIILLGISYSYDYHNILFKDPQSIHIWRQCDCLSITTNYYHDSNPLIEPTIHHQGYDNTGKAMSDFPIIYYTVAQLWKIFGHHEYMLRLFVLTLFFIALFYLFKTFESFFNDSILAILCSLFIFTSPTIVYYANNFLMDIPAMALALIGFSLFLKYTRTSNKKQLYWCAIFYTLGSLLKVSALLSFFIIIALFLLEIIGIPLKSNREKIFKSPWLAIGIFLVSLGIVFSWYAYARNYNETFNKNLFLLSALPIWELDSTTSVRIFNSIRQHFKVDYFNIESQIFFIGCFLTLLVFTRKKNIFITLMTIIGGLGVISFFLLFFQSFENHDYYAINLLVVVPILLFATFYTLKMRFNKIFAGYLLKIGIVILLFHNVTYTNKYVKERYRIGSWQNNSYVKYYQPFRDIQPYIDSLGIAKDDRVISLSDNSPNISLYFMNRKGWSNYGLNHDSTKIANCIDMGAKYIFVYKKEVYEKPQLASYFENQIGQFENIDIFRVSSENNVDRNKH